MSGELVQHALHGMNIFWYARLNAFDGCTSSESRRACASLPAASDCAICALHFGIAGGSICSGCCGLSPPTDLSLFFPSPLSSRAL